MSGIEFVDADPVDPVDPVDAAPADTAPVADPRGGDGRSLHAGAAVCWLAAGILGVLAAYRPTLHVSYGTPAVFGYSVDAWGHYGGGGAAEAVLRGPHYGPVLCAVAVGCLGLGICGAVRATRPVPRHLALAADALGYAPAGLLAGLAIAMDLQVGSALGNVRAGVHRLAGLGDPVNGDVHTVVGSAVTLAIAAAICAVVAAALGPLWRALRRRR